MFLASLSAMALLTITSHHHLHHSHNTITLHKAVVVSRQTPSSPQLHLTSFSHGTRVTVRDLFGNMPVRVKQRAMSAEKQRGNSKEWEELRREAVLLLLAWPRSIAVTIREAVTNEKLHIRGYMGAPTSISQKLVDPVAVCSILSQASLISVEDKPFWVAARATTAKITISAAISLIPSATKHTQFISFGIRPLTSHHARSMLHAEVNQMFLNSAFGNEEEVIGLDASELDRRARDKRHNRDGFTNKELRGGRKGIDRWPMFYINIEHNDPVTQRMRIDVDDILDDKRSSLTAIVELLQAMIWEFLAEHHFHPKATRGRRMREAADARVANIQNIEEEKDNTNCRTSIHSGSELEKMQRQSSISRPLHSGETEISVKGHSPYPRPSKLEAPFDLWTRIKSGSRPTKLAKQADKLDASIVPRPASAPPSLTISTSRPKLDSVKGLVASLLSSKGKLVRRPFEDVAFPAVKPRPPIGKAQQPPEDSAELGEDMIAWINPVTKVKSLVNERTGLSVRTGNHNSSRNNTASPSTASMLSILTRLPHGNTKNTEGPSPWLDNILRTWNNPVFCPAELSIPQVTLEGQEAGAQEILHGRHHHCSQIDIDRAFKESSAGIDGRISKTALGRAEVISQVDNKFILARIDSTTGVDATGDRNLLVLIDQHAADERIRIEDLLGEFFAPAADTAIPTGSGVKTNPLDKPINFEVSLKESRLLHKYKEHFIRWGIIFDLSTHVARLEAPSKGAEVQRLTVRCLPPGIIERCKLDPRPLIDLIRTEVWKVHDEGTHAPSMTNGDWLERIHTCPRGIIDMLNSRACRSAIMFNDELSKQQCEALVSKLAKCKFPFQCAHGRPSLVPLVNLERMEMKTAKPVMSGYDNGPAFGAGFNQWKKNIK